MFLRIEIEEKRHLGLSMREMWVYSALKYLCRDTPYKGSYSELAEICDFDNKVAAFRAVTALVEKGLIERTENGLKTLHSETQALHSETKPLHSETESLHSETLSKKESNQRKNNKREKKEVSECDNSAHTHTQEDLKDNNSVHSEHKRSVGTTRPTWQEWYAYGKEQGINYLTCLKSFAYYESIGWAKISNWRATLIYWDLKDKTR